MAGTLPLLLKHLKSTLSDPSKGIITGVPIGLALTALIFYLRMGKPDEA